MKAKQLASMYIHAADHRSCLALIVQNLSADVATLCDARNIKTDEGLVGVIREVDRKYHAMVRIVKKDVPKERESIIPDTDMFKNFIKQFFPEIYPHVYESKTVIQS